MPSLKATLTLIVLSPVYFYRYCISPLIAPRCRFVPTCSEYAVEVIKTKGIIKGGWLTLKRLSKCHPFYKGCRHDPVPK